jgi:hypothetical protein|tara:strand:+ start:6156 stop:6311 length:156 start_codon:yes stop_codon:yes gene_type:complete
MITKAHTLLFLDQLTPYQAKRRMAEEEKRMQQEWEECGKDAQTLFDEMFGG